MNKFCVNVVLNLAFGGDADYVLGGVRRVGDRFLESRTGYFALGAEFGRCVTFVNVTANGADPFFHDFFSLF